MGDLEIDERVPSTSNSPNENISMVVKPKLENTLISRTHHYDNINTTRERYTSENKEQTYDDEDDEDDTHVHDRYTPLTVSGSNDGIGNDRDGLSPGSEHSVASYEWSFEEQFKQLYELDSDGGRKAFLDDYFDFMKRRGTPVSRIPIMAKQILDLFQLYNLVVRHGGLVQVIRNKQWSKVTKGLHLPTSITSAAFTLRTQYLKYLYPYECAMHSLSTPKELQAAIDSNRRDRFSTLYHPEPSMTSQRDDRFPPFPINGYEFGGVPPSVLHQSPHHHPLSVGGIKSEVKYPLKRPLDTVGGRGYDKYGNDNPKVIILQDGHQVPADGYGQDKPPISHLNMKSPITHEMDPRKINEYEMMRQRVHHMMYNGKDWDGDIRHVIEEEQRYHYQQHAHRNSDQRIMCKDKNCNGVDCKYPYPERREIRRHHGSAPPACACNYCTDKLSQRYPSPGSRSRDNDEYRHSAEVSHVNTMKERTASRLDSTGSGERSPPSPTQRVSSNGGDKRSTSVSPPVSVFKARISDSDKATQSDRASQSDQGVFIALEIAGRMYEGFVHLKENESNRSQ